MTHDLVNRSAHRLGVGRISRWCIVEWGRNALLDVDHEVMAERVEFLGGNARLDMRGNEIEHLGCQTAGDAHLLDVFGTLEGDRHGNWHRAAADTTTAKMRKFTLPGLAISPHQWCDPQNAASRSR